MKSHFGDYNTSCIVDLDLIQLQAVKIGCRYVQLARLDIPPDCIALLDTVWNVVPCPPASSFRIRASSFSTSGDAFGSSGLLFP